MTRFLLCFISMVTSLAVSSQKVYFVYLQSEETQPFFVKMDERVYSSSASGYLILSKLRDSTYSFSVGFPQVKWPEQKFLISIKSKDHGYLLKNFGEKGWGLFDLQTLAIQMPVMDNKGSSYKTEKTEVSAFTNILAKAADDSTLREKPVVVKVEEKKAEEKVPEIKQPDVALNEKVKEQEPQKEIAVIPVEKKEEPKTEIKEQPEIKTVGLKADSIPPYKNSLITKRSEGATSEGITLLFTDEQPDGANDTITILIPNPQPIVTQTQEQPKEEKKFLDLPIENKNTDTIISSSGEIVKEVTTPKPITRKNTCKEVANESDFLKLRKKMVAETDDDDMVDEARKYFKTKCFTTSQVKNLGVLFLDDLGKYKFFDMAYIFVSDMENFPSLQSELKNEYYINRFKSMLK